MINFKNNKGVTLVILIVTIIVLFIIAGVTITGSIDSIDQTIDSQDTSEMLIIQHAIKQRYTEYIETNGKTKLIGTMKYPESAENTDEYYQYELVGEENFEKLGINGKNIKGSNFEVNYKTGYVKKVGLSEETALKGYNKDVNNSITSNMIEIY